MPKKKKQTPRKPAGFRLLTQPLAMKDKSTNKKPRMEACPKCGQPFDPTEHGIYECPRCCAPGSTACCNPGGNNCLCVDCENTPPEKE